jgi:3-phosphoshikimate 1-carboxyvinyltransferase
MTKLPDILEIKPLTKPPNCTITVPGSKSITNRALILAALADGKCTLRGALWADDTQVMVDSLQKLGFEVTVEPDPAEECNRTITVVGRGGEIPAKKAELYVGNAGTAARFLTALVCLGHGEYRIRGDARMHERPMGELFDVLTQQGASIRSNSGRLPAVIDASGLRGGEIVVSGEETSQFASALQLISQKANLSVTMRLKAGEEHQYFVMTSDMLFQDFSDYRVEPDMSSASYFTATQFIWGGQIEIANQPSQPLQVDARFSRYFPHRLTAIEQQTTHPKVLERLTSIKRVSRLLDLGDSVMTLGICALFGDQPIRIVEAARMRLQETDRIKAMVTELKKMGGEKCAEETDDGFIVRRGDPSVLCDGKRKDIETYNDHRMAMCFAVLGLKVPGIRIKNPGCVSKTFPNFFEKLEQLRS